MCAMTRKLVSVGVFVVFVSAFVARAETQAEKDAQAQWKADVNVQLAAFKSELAIFLTSFNGDVDTLADAFKGGADPFANLAGMSILLGSAYNDLEGAIESRIDLMDDQASALLQGVGKSALAGFMINDGGTTTKAMASVRKEVAKYEKAVSKGVKKIQAAVKSGSAGVRMLFNQYPLPIGFSIVPSDLNAGSLNGFRPNAPLWAVGVVDATQIAGFSGGITQNNNVTVQIFEDTSNIDGVTASVGTNGVYVHGGSTTVATANLWFVAFHTTGTAIWSAYLGGLSQ